LISSQLPTCDYNFNFDPNFNKAIYNSANLTTASGEPISDDSYSLTVGERGPIVLADITLLEKLRSFSSERIPERVVHAKGVGALGVFTLTNDMSPYTRADLFTGIGKTTPVFVRFSTTMGEVGAAFSVRDGLGFAVKFYTLQGNYDIVGVRLPVFFINDPIKFPDFIHCQKREPSTGVHNADNKWDFFS
jgi:catalase